MCLIKFRKSSIILLKKSLRPHFLTVFQSNKYSLFCWKLRSHCRQNLASIDYFNTKIADFLNFISRIFSKIIWLIDWLILIWWSVYSRFEGVIEINNRFPHFCFSTQLIAFTKKPKNFMHKFVQNEITKKMPYCMQDLAIHPFLLN